MDIKLTIVFFASLIFYSGFLYSDGIILIDSLDKIESCSDLSKKLKPVVNNQKRQSAPPIYDYNTLNSSILTAQEKFFQLEIDESNRMFDDIIKRLSDSVVVGGGLEEIYNIFSQAIFHKILIVLSKKDENKAKELLKEYLFILGRFPNNSKKIHPSLRSFLSQNIDSAKNSVINDTETAKHLQRFIGKGKSILFDGLSAIPDKITRGRHLLIVANPDKHFRIILRDFSRDLDEPLYIEEFNKNVVYLTSNEEAFAIAKSQNQGQEIVFCRDGESGLILSDGKILNKDMAILRDVKVEIIRADEVKRNTEWYEDWWIYVAGGSLVGVIITSIIIFNTGENKEGTFKDKIQIR